MPGDGGNPNPPDKPGQWKYHEVQNSTESLAKLNDWLAKGYKVSLVGYKYLDEKALAENLQHG